MAGVLVWLKNSADDILKHFFPNYSQKIGFDISCKLSLNEQYRQSVVCRGQLESTKGLDVWSHLNGFIAISQRGTNLQT